MRPGLLCEYQLSRYPGGASRRLARSARSGGEHNHRLHERSRLPHGRARPLSKAEPLRRQRAGATLDRGPGQDEGRGGGRTRQPGRSVSDPHRARRGQGSGESPGAIARADVAGSRGEGTWLGPDAGGSWWRIKAASGCGEGRGREALLWLQPAHGSVALHGVG